MREFDLWHLKPEQVTQGFIDFCPTSAPVNSAIAGHDNDRGCALHAAVERTLYIAEERFDNHHRILESMSQVKTRKTFSDSDTDR